MPIDLGKGLTRIAQAIRAVSLLVATGCVIGAVVTCVDAIPPSGPDVHFSVTAPEGATYAVTAPAGTTSDQAIEFARDQVALMMRRPPVELDPDIWRDTQIKPSDRKAERWQDAPLANEPQIKLHMPKPSMRLPLQSLGLLLGIAIGASALGLGVAWIIQGFVRE